MKSPFIVHAFILLLATLFLSRIESAPFPPGTAASGFVRNMVLVYLDSRSTGSTADPRFVFSPSKFRSLISYKGEPFFDAVQLIGYSWKDNKCFWPGECATPMNGTDWKEIMDLWFEMGVQYLNAATMNASSTLKAPDPIKLFVTIPYPDTRQQRFGNWCGRSNFNFSLPADRVDATRCWCLSFQERFNAEGYGDRITLTGFYWFLENLTPEDQILIQAVSTFIHTQLFPPGAVKFNWIPGFYARNDLTQWAKLGFDFTTLQPNFAFQNTTAASRFAAVNSYMTQYNSGVEMELPFTCQNGVIQNNATQSFLDYLQAAVQYGWVKNALKTYYYGNDFAIMAANKTNNVQQVLLEQLYLLTSGRLGV